MQKAPRSEVSASLRDLNSGSSTLPWTSIIFYGTSARGQRAVSIGPGVVCSRDANGCSGRGVRKHAIAAKVVSKRLVAGGVGKRAGFFDIWGRGEYAHAVARRDHAARGAR